MSEGPTLQRCSFEDFQIVTPSGSRWIAVSPSWSPDAAPGDWVRRYNASVPRFMPEDKPEGTVIAVIPPHRYYEMYAGKLETGSMQRFLVLWFR